MNKCFFDTEFTGLHQATTLISIGVCNAFGDTFYAELTDYAQDQINPWLRENVLANLTLDAQPEGEVVTTDDDLALCRGTTIRGNKAQVRIALTKWLTTPDTHKLPVQMWSDCLAYDWVLFNDLLANYSDGYPQLPKGIHYIPMDICALFEVRNIDPDISRELFAYGVKMPYAPKHNALWDAQTIARCYHKLSH